MITKLLFLFLLLATWTDGWGVPPVPDEITSSASSEVGASRAGETEPSSVQRERFITVDGPDLKSKMEAAAKLGRSNSSAAKFWTAYSFDVRPGVAVDAEIVSSDGNRTFVQSASVSVGGEAETRNLGVFLLHESGNNLIARVEVYNLERRREYSGYPVYWLGRANNQESLSMLNDLIESNQAAKIAENSIMALALHDDARVSSMLKNAVQRSSLERIKKSAIFWLGQVGGEQAFLASLVRNEQESVELRKQGAFAIGVSKDSDALSVLENLYTSVTPREVRKQIIFAASVNNSKDAGVTFLIKVASSDPDRELKKQAIFWLGQKAGQRSLEFLGNTLDSDPDTEVQKQAVFAISRRPREESVPILIRIAKTHAKAEVRKQAMFWLGQTGDERALEFFREVLLK